MKSIPAKTREKKKEDGYVYIPKDTKEERMDLYIRILIILLGYAN